MKNKSIAGMLQRSWSIRTLPRWATITAGLLLALLTGMLVLLAFRWPFLQERVIASIERATGSRVGLQQYHTTFFPEPGCIIGGLIIDRQTRQPIARAHRITIQSSWWNVLTFRKRIQRIGVERLHIQIPSPFPPGVSTGSSRSLEEVVIGEFMADDAILDFFDTSAATRFVIHQLRLREMGKNRQITYAAVLDIPDPPGQVKSSGTVGPFARDGIGKTRVAGSFELLGARLGKYKGLAGSVTGRGRFHGPLENMRVTGTAVASAFEVNHTGHPVGDCQNWGHDMNQVSVG